MLASVKVVNAKKDTKKLGSDFDLADWNNFHAWCKKHRYVKTGAATAALDLLQLLPLELREIVMCAEWALVKECLDRASEMTQGGHRFAKAGAEKAILNMSSRPALSVSPPPASTPAPPKTGRKERGG